MRALQLEWPSNVMRRTATLPQLWAWQCSEQFENQLAPEPDTFLQRGA